MSELAQVAINPVVGPEVVTGSTRMKAGTAQKMVLNTISTGVMIKMGYVYENLMINVQPTNEKLVKRATGILSQILKINENEAGELLEEAHKDVSAAILMNKKKISYDRAYELLKNNNYQVNKII